MTLKLPDFIDIHYQRLSQEIDIEERSSIVSNIFFKTISFAAKLHLLEYAQSKRVDDKFNYWLFSRCDIKNIDHLLSIIDYTSKQKKQIKTVLPIKSFSHIFNDIAFQERFSRLKWFHDVASLNKNLESISDIDESEEHLQHLFLLLNFIQNSKYVVRDNVTFIRFKQKALSLSPFFAAKLVGSDGLHLYEKPATIKDFSKEWLSESYTKYQSEKKGIISFPQPQNEQMIVMPWVETFLEDSLEEIFYLPPGIKLKTILVEGAPNTGKTALCGFIDTFLPKIDSINKYYVSPQSIYQDSATFKFWFYRSLKNIFDVQKNIVNIQDLDITIAAGWQELRKKLTASDKKIICCIDGINFMPEKEFRRFLTFITDDLFCNIVFIFFSRTHTKNKIDATYKICLNPQDNIAFEEAFNQTYVNNLLTDYLYEKETQKIFNYLVKEKQSNEFTIKDLSEELEICTPKVLKYIESIKPLLVYNKEKQTLRLFDIEVCHQLSLSSVDKNIDL
ncbi:hypothetical protein [Candidatus Uabimicrobium sp. HlEnr_7]|uniref:hypothetical protein n=1 Tax=Candidatus Uabimicrobium helgolandensis TaxID=3095367 RepID=UPI003558032D